MSVERFMAYLPSGKTTVACTATVFYTDAQVERWLWLNDFAARHNPEWQSRLKEDYSIILKCWASTMDSYIKHTILAEDCDLPPDGVEKLREVSDSQSRNCDVIITLLNKSATMHVLSKTVNSAKFLTHAESMYIG